MQLGKRVLGGLLISVDAWPLVLIACIRVGWRHRCRQDTGSSSQALGLLVVSSLCGNCARQGAGPECMGEAEASRDC